jgi:regulator of protease activity HflC (stomatin/prohibitin superfamily)
MSVVLVLLILVVIFSLSVFFGTLFTVEQQSAAIIERFGKYRRTAHAGLNIKIPFVESIRQRVNLKVQQLIVEVETKTKDNVFVKMPVAVQYHVTEGREADSYYKLENHQSQIESYVLDVVRAKVPTMTLDEAFEKKDDVGNDVRQQLGDSMRTYGFTIDNALVRDVDPAENVKNAMNEIQTQQRLQVAAAAKGEAAKIIAVKNAEAEKETKKLQGEGVAAEREAIAEGIKKSTEMLVEASGGQVDAAQAMTTLLMTQYFDTLRTIGIQGHATTVFLPHSPGGMGDIRQQIAEAVMIGGQVPKADAGSTPTVVKAA